MGTWKNWSKISTGPYQGKLELRMVGLGESGFQLEVRDQSGNVIQYFPGAPNIKESLINTGGAGIIAHLAVGPTKLGGFLATGIDGCLYHVESNGSQSRWQKTFGPGKFLGSVYSWATMDGCAEVLGEGTDHQLAYAHISPKQDRDNIKQWENLGQPGEVAGEKGLNGRLSVVYDGQGLHVLVRGQDNHLWHTFGKNNDHQAKRTFSNWTNLGGGLCQPPVAICTRNGIECFVIGEDNEPFVNTWDGVQWHGFVSMGGQLNGLPTAVYIEGSNQTFVFGRGIHDQLWYCQRNGTDWQEWQSIGDGLTGDPAVWEESISDGTELISCVVLRQNGSLWLRELHLARSE